MAPTSRRLIPISLALALLLGALVAPGARAGHDRGRGTTHGRKPKVEFRLTILHNNDGESELLGDPEFGGVARFRTLVDDLKDEATHSKGHSKGKGGVKRGVVMLSSGDNFLAGPQFNASLEKGPPFYDTIALNLVGYDALAIGNHEFDFGPEVLADFIGGFSRKVPFLSSNLDVSPEPALEALADRDRIAGSTVVKERGERIGIIGATTPQLPFISSPRNVVVDPDVAGAIQAEVEALESWGVDKIILISHLQSLAEDLALAPELSGIDVMIAGGGDELLANEDDLLIPGDVAAGPYPTMATDADGKPVPVVTTSGQYFYVGRLVAGFDRHGRVVKLDGGPVRVSGVSPDAVPADRTVERRVTEPVAASVAALGANVIGTSEVSLNGVRGDIRTVETNEGNLIADALLSQAAALAPSFGAPTPDVALQNGGGIRNDSVIPPGNITELDTFDMLPFSNFLSVVPDIPRSQFKEILENAVSRVEFVDGRFAQIAGFSMTWDSTGTPQELDADGNVVTPGTRVVDVTLSDGTPIVDGGSVVPGAGLNIATIDFSARGGDQYPFRGAPFTTLGVSYQQALEAYIEVTLGGLITASAYPEGGEGRITRLA
ncbi:MAG: bifunctional metallophosphatase/5'-nucleotidase [Actinomycetota bacterium]